MPNYYNNPYMPYGGGYQATPYPYVAPNNNQWLNRKFRHKLFHHNRNQWQTSKAKICRFHSCVF